MARVIGGDELGRTMILTLVLRLAEMLSDAGVERFLMQRPGPISPALLAALHGAAVLRGAATAAFLLALALPPRRYCPARRQRGPMPPWHWCRFCAASRIWITGWRKGTAPRALGDGRGRRGACHAGLGAAGAGSAARSPRHRGDPAGQ
ncbi:MAG: hypothetical protein HZT43_17215 [Exiguobacterium profundum]|nr:MAG: hypothetical protein HZT43_17215 [Exiguobacterium profundum]